MSKIFTLELGFANAFLISDSKGTIIVDTGMKVTKEKFIEVFAQHGIDPANVNLIIITHAHVDHFDQSNELKELTGAPLLCHRNAVDALRAGKSTKVVARNALGEKVLQVMGRKVPIEAKPVEPDLVMDTEFDLSPYGISGKILHTPGHSDCSVSVLLDSGEAIVGDIVVPSFFTREPSLAYFGNDEQALLTSVRRLLAEAHIFYAAHGGPFTREVVAKLLAEA